MSTDNVKFSNIFNKTFSDFLADLVVAYPSDPDFKTFKHSFNILKSVDQFKGIKTFKKYVIEYRKQIVEKDSDFFMKEDFKNVAAEKQDVTNELISKLKNYWTSMSEDNKESVWGYLLVLLKTSDRYT